jgi:diadenosine tetraphosphate (Ap4A) HIT family hydrolase
MGCLGSGTMAECLVCEQVAGRWAVPGGIIYESDRWLVDHCIGPLGVGTLIIKPKRHVVHVWDLDDEEAAELGPLLRRTTSVVAELTRPSQVYACLWSHTGGETGGEPGHIHRRATRDEGAAASMRRRRPRSGRDVQRESPASACPSRGVRSRGAHSVFLDRHVRRFALSGARASSPLIQLVRYYRYSVVTDSSLCGQSSKRRPRTVHRTNCVRCRYDAAAAGF